MMKCGLEQRTLSDINQLPRNSSHVRNMDPSAAAPSEDGPDETVANEDAHEERKREEGSLTRGF